MNFCPFIDTTLIFTEDCITPCYTTLSDNKPFYLNKDSKKEELFSFLEKKESLNEIINSTNINFFDCKNCCHLVTEKTKYKKYNHFILALWGNTSFKYDFFAIIKNIYENNMVDKNNLIIEIQSGNLSNIKNLDEIISVFKNYGYKEIQFMMNNVVLNTTIENILAEGKSSLNIIPNAKNNEFKNRETDIKNILRHYLNAAKDKNSITVYLELIQGINDNAESVNDFIRTMYMCGLNRIAIRLDNNDINNWLQKDIPLLDCPKHIASLFLNFFKLCRKYSFYVDMNYTEQNIVLRKIFKTYKNKTKKRNKIKSLLYRTNMLKSAHRRRYEI